MVRLSGKAHRSARVDKGRKRPRGDNDNTEAAFLRKRRAAHPNQDGARSALDNLAPSAIWGDQHDRELAFARQKVEHRHTQAAREGLLLPDEVRDTDEVDVAHEVDKIVRAIKDRRRAELRHELVQHGGASRDSVLATIRGQSAFSHEPTDVALLTQLGLTRSDDPSTADVHLKGNTSSLQGVDDVHMWVAAMSGSAIVVLKQPSSSSSTSRGPREVAAFIKLRKAMGRPAGLYITAKFRAKHPQHFDMVRRCVGASGAWHLLPNRAAYIAGDTRRSAKTIALIQEVDRSREETNAFCNSPSHHSQFHTTPNPFHCPTSSPATANHSHCTHRSLLGRDMCTVG